MLPVGDDLNDVARQQRTRPVSALFPVQNRAALEVTTTANERQLVTQALGFADPGDDGLVRSHHPLPVVLADGTDGRRLFALGVLRSAGCADEVRHGVSADRDLRMRFPRLAPMCLVELFRTAPGDCQRIPLLSCVDSGDLNDLADVI